MKVTDRLLSPSRTYLNTMNDKHHNNINYVHCVCNMYIVHYFTNNFDTLNNFTSHDERFSTSNYKCIISNLKDIHYFSNIVQMTSSRLGTKIVPQRDIQFKTLTIFPFLTPPSPFCLNKKNLKFFIFQIT